MFDNSEINFLTVGIMIQYFAFPEIGLGIQKGLGEIDIQSMYEFARNYLLGDKQCKFHYVIVDTREAEIKFSVEEMIEYSQWLIKNENTDSVIEYLYLATSAQATAYSMILGNLFKDRAVSNIFFTLKKALAYIDLVDHYDEIGSLIKDDNSFL